MRNLEEHNVSVCANRNDDPPDDNVPEWYTTATRNAASIFRNFGAKTWGDVYRAFYDSNSLSLRIGFEDGDIKVNDELYDFDRTAPVIIVMVGSIVEGVDVECRTLTVDLTAKGTRKTGNVVKRLYAAAHEVKSEADYIWSQTHGCPKCKTEGEWGHDAINPKCRSCKGQGTIL